MVHLKQIPPVVMQEEEEKPSEGYSDNQIEVKVHSPPPTDWEIFLYIKVTYQVSKKYKNDKNDKKLKIY